MDQQQKAAKLMENYDRLAALPEGIVSKIVSFLPLKQAIRTSVLSRSWKSVWWTSRPDFTFDSINILGIPDYGVSSSVLSEFSERVHHVLRRRCVKMDSVAFRFSLSLCYPYLLTRWISYAIVKGVENIDLDFSDGPTFEVDDTSFSTASEQYTFPFWLLANPGKACKVKHLKLTSCSLDSLSNSKTLPSLVSVELRGVDITGEHLEGLLCTCLFLERFLVHSCKNLVDLKIPSQSSRLKFFTIQNCSRMDRVEICAENLEMFEYTGESVSLSFKNVPKLAEVFLCFTGVRINYHVSNALSRMANALPQLKTLNVVGVPVDVIEALRLPENAPAFINMKHLVFSVCPFLDCDKLYWTSNILKYFPLLNKLQLNLFSTGFSKQSEDRDKDLPECSHKHLKELVINGYVGNQHEVELLKYLVANAVELDRLVINPSQKSYRGLNNWSDEESNSRYKLSTEDIDQLHAIVPPTVHIEVRRDPELALDLDGRGRRRDVSIYKPNGPIWLKPNRSFWPKPKA